VWSSVAIVAGLTPHPAAAEGGLSVGGGSSERQELSAKRDVGFRSLFCNGFRMTHDAHDAFSF
jgi:hypothetical protein